MTLSSDPEFVDPTSIPFLNLIICQLSLVIKGQQPEAIEQNLLVFIDYRACPCPE